MALTYSDIQAKTQRLAKSANPDVLAQLMQDWNTGYHMFNAKLARYYSRKQQFADLIATQRYYQTPYDCVRVTGVSVLVGSTYEPITSQVRSEQDWRKLVSYPMNSNWPTNFFPLGNDQVGLWPTPGVTVTKGLRLWYQPQDHDLTLQDITSTSSGSFVNVVNDSISGAGTVTAVTGTPFNAGMVGLSFQVTGVTDVSWYEIVAATTTILTLKQSFVGSSVNNASWRVGQLSIIPQEYADAPMHYALGNYFSGEGDEVRSQFHLGNKDKPGMFYSLMADCEESYSSSTTSNVITEDEDFALNIWLVPPPAH